MKVQTFSDMELSGFSGQLALILHSGISSLEGISILLEDTADKKEQEVLKQIEEELQSTGSLYTSLKETGWFPAYFLSMVRIGEETGTLDEVMSALSLHYEREDALRRNLRNALTYPLTMSAMMVAVIVILLVKVMPIFQQVFVQLGTEMTGFSKALMSLGTALNRYSAFFLILLLLLLAVGFFGTRTEKGHRFFQRLFLHFPDFRTMQEKMSLCRLAGGLSISLKSGLTQSQSLELSEMLPEDDAFRGKLEICRQGLDEGQDLVELLREQQIFTGLYARMASIGARTGSLDQAMEKIAVLCQEDMENRTARLLSALEPTLVITLSLIVGAILLSVMLPLMGILSSL